MKVDHVDDVHDVAGYVVAARGAGVVLVAYDAVDREVEDGVDDPDKVDEAGVVGVDQEVDVARHVVAIGDAHFVVIVDHDVSTVVAVQTVDAVAGVVAQPSADVVVRLIRNHHLTVFSAAWTAQPVSVSALVAPQLHPTPYPVD